MQIINQLIMLNVNFLNKSKRKMIFFYLTKHDVKNRNSKKMLSKLNLHSKTKIFFSFTLQSVSSQLLFQFKCVNYVVNCISSHSFASSLL